VKGVPFNKHLKAGGGTYSFLGALVLEMHSNENRRDQRTGELKDPWTRGQVDQKEKNVHQKKRKTIYNRIIPLHFMEVGCKPWHTFRISICRVVGNRLYSSISVIQP